MLGYRIGHKNYIKTLTPSGADGRWVSAGRFVIYCAESLPLAFLENMVRRQGVGFNTDFKIAILDIPDNLRMLAISASAMKPGWRKPKDYTLCQEKGNKWYDKTEYPILKAPSVILPDSNNYVINTRHKEFKKIKIIRIADLVPDERIEEILKSYRK